MLLGLLSQTTSANAHSNSDALMGLQRLLQDTLNHEGRPITKIYIVVFQHRLQLYIPNNDCIDGSNNFHHHANYHSEIILLMHQTRGLGDD